MDLDRGDGSYVRKPRLRQGEPKRTPLWLTICTVLCLGAAIVVGPLAYALHHRTAALGQEQSRPAVTTSPPSAPDWAPPAQPEVPGNIACSWLFTDALTEHTILPEDYAPSTDTATFTLTTNLGLIAVTIDRTLNACAAESTRNLIATGFYTNVTCAPIGRPAVAVGCGRQDPGYGYGADGSDPMVRIIIGGPSTSPEPDVRYECTDFKPTGVLRGDLCLADGSPWPPIKPTTTQRGIVALVADADNIAGGRLVLEYAEGTLADAVYPPIGRIVAGQELLDQAVRSKVPLKILSAAMA